LRHVYIPSATSWVFSSLHASVGLAFVGAVVGEYLGSASGVGYLILQAEGTFDINTVVAGIIVLTVFALILDGIVSITEKYALTWRPAAGETEKLEQCAPVPPEAIAVFSLTYQGAASPGICSYDETD